MTVIRGLSYTHSGSLTIQLCEWFQVNFNLVQTDDAASLCASPHPHSLPQDLSVQQEMPVRASTILTECDSEEQESHCLINKFEPIRAEVDG